MRIFQILFIDLLFFISPVIQGQYINFQETIGGNDWEYGYALRITSDNGAIIGGVSRSSFTGANGNDAYLVKTDIAGNLQWAKTYGTPGIEVINDVCQTSDGGYLFGGYSYQAAGSPLNGAYVVKVSGTGDKLWSRIFNFNNSGGDCYALTEATDGNYIIGNYTPASGVKGYLAGLIKLDQNGDTVWTRIYDGPGNDWIYGIDKTQDSGYVLSGYTTNSLGGKDFLLMKVDASGNLKWAKTYGGTGDEDAFGHSVLATPDGGFLIFGETAGFGAGGKDMYLVKTDSSGNLLWSKTYGSVGDDIGHAIQPTSDNGYILLGWTKSFGQGILNGNENILLTKNNSSGDTLWTKVFGGPGLPANGGGDLGYDVKENSIGYLVSGRTLSFGSGADIYLIQTNFEGNTGCNQYPADGLIVGSPSTMASTPLLTQSSGCSVIHPNITVSSGGVIDSLCVITGLGKKNFNDFTITVTPNPVTTQMKIKVNIPQIFKGAELKCFSPQGIEFLQCSLMGTDVIIVNSNNLPKGICLVALFQDGKILASTKIIIN